MPDFPPAPVGLTVPDIYEYQGKLWIEDELWSVAGKFSTETGGTGVINYYWWAIELQTGMTVGSYARFYRDFYSHWVPFTWAKKRRLKVCVMFSDNADQNVHIGTGRCDASGSENIVQHVGFKAVGGTLYGTVADGTTESTLDLGLVETLTDTMLEVVFDPTLATPEARFYVNEVDKGSITSNLPSGTTMADVALWARVNNTAVNNIQLWVMAVRFIQEE